MLHIWGPKYGATTHMNKKKRLIEVFVSFHLDNTSPNLYSKMYLGKMLAIIFLAEFALWGFFWL